MYQLRSSGRHCGRLLPYLRGEEYVQAAAGGC